MIKRITAFVIAIIIASLTFNVTTYAINSEWIYYSNENDVSKLYKIRKDGTGLKRLSTETAYDIAVLNDWIYYYNNSKTGGVFRTKTDGSVTEKLIDGFENECYGVYKDNGFVYAAYFYGNEISYGEPGFTYSMINIYNQDGLYSSIELDSSEIDSKTAKCIDVRDNCIYYSSNSAFYCMELNFDAYDVRNTISEIDSVPQKVKKDSKETIINNCDFYRNKYLHWKPVSNAEKYVIYRLNEKNGKYKKLAETLDSEINLTVLNSQYNCQYKVAAIKKVNGDTKKYKVKMLEEKTEAYSVSASAVNYKGTDYVCRNDGIYRISGDLCKKIRDGKAEQLCADDNGLFFVDNGRIYRMNFDGSEEKTVASIYNVLGFDPENVYLDIHCIAVYGDKLLVNFEGENESYDVHTMLIGIDDGEAVEIGNLTIYDICFVENKIIFISDDNLVYSMKHDGSELKCISDEKADNIYAYKGKIYYCNNSGIYEMNCDGTMKHNIMNEDVKRVVLYNNRIFYIQTIIVEEQFSSYEEYSVCSVALDGKDKQVHISNCPTDDMNICGKYIYYRNTNGDLCKLNY